MKQVKPLGHGTLLYKVDGSHSHFVPDPDFFERCSDAIRYIMETHNHNALFFILTTSYRTSTTIHVNYLFWYSSG